MMMSIRRMIVMTMDVMMTVMDVMMTMMMDVMMTMMMDVIRMDDKMTTMTTTMTMMMTMTRRVLAVFDRHAHCCQEGQDMQQHHRLHRDGD